jgi:hypothetical protein
MKRLGTSLLLIGPVVATVSPFQTTSTITQTATVVIPGFPFESIASGLVLGLFVVLLLRLVDRFGWNLVKRNHLIQ